MIVVSKKFILIFLLLITLAGCNLNIGDTDNKDTTQSLSLDNVDDYYETMIHILDAQLLSDIDREAYNLISDNLYKNIEKSYDNKESTINKNDLDGLDGPEVDDQSEQINNKYPIIDDYGTIYKYGSKEESEISYERFNSLPRYELVSYKIIGNNIRLKIFLREIKTTQSYILNIDIESGQIISYGVA